MNNKHIFVVIAVVILVAGAFVLGTTRNAEAPQELSGQTDNEANTEAQVDNTTDTEEVTPTNPQNGIDAVVDLTAPTPTPKPTPKPSSNLPIKPATPAAPSYTSVTYDGQNFSPKEVSIRLGGTVRFTNLSDDDMWIASDIHPMHSGYQVKDEDSCSGYAFDQCKSVEKGGYYQFTFKKAGKYGYHNHASAADNGYVDVKDPNAEITIPGY